jgi:hypothetical protein
LLAVAAIVVGLAAMVLAAVRTSGTLVLRLEVGECILVPESVTEGSIATVDTVRCDDEHEAQVIDVGELDIDRPADGTEFDPTTPGVYDELFAAAAARCEVALEGIDGAAERFGVLPVIADEGSWERFPGRYVCLAIPYGGGAVSSPLAT